MRARRRPGGPFLALFLLLFVPRAGCDLTLNTVVLADPSLFSTALYERVLSAYGNATVVSIQADLITGTEARRSYFPNRSTIYAFQLLHITRVQATVQTRNDTLTTTLLHASLPAACQAAGVGAVAIDSVVLATPALLDSMMEWIASLPPATVIVLTAGWLLTAISCSVCWLFYCCCAPRRTEAIPTAEVVVAHPTAPIVAAAVPPPPAPAMPATVLRWAEGGTPAIRLPLALTPMLSANQYDPYARLTIPSGLAPAR
jgi:hypothetical protein